MRNYRWGILAPGAISHKFTKGLQTIPHAALYAVGSRSLERADAFAKQYGFEKAYGSYQELVNDPLVDIIYVATPHPQHEEATILCLNHGKAVICEKPFAVNARQAERMIRCAREKGVFLMEAMWTRFLPTVLKTRELIADGAIGDVRVVCADFGFRANVDPQGRLFAPACGGGSLLDVGVYNISFCSMIFGEQPEKVRSHMAIGSTGVDEETSILLGYKGGQSALLNSAIRLNTPHEAKIFATEGRIELPSYWNGSAVKLYNADGMQEFLLPYAASGYQFEALEAMRCLDEGLLESPMMPLEESLDIMRTLDLIRRDNQLRYPCDEE